VYDFGRRDGLHETTKRDVTERQRRSEAGAIQQTVESIEARYLYPSLGV
jgi:hypothetical protein